ncbi:MAG TPA: metal-dependent hydrolase [Chloroflexi bacterium]|nr:metal-dependent hydrolase [Chloroflexota bacterium]
MSFKVKWLGHASFAMEIDGYRVLLDPFITGNPATDLDPDALEADFILISHGHGDHVGDAVSIAKRTKARVIANFEIVNWFTQQGIENTHPQHIGGGFHHDFGYVKLTIAHHGSALPDGSYGGNPAGFLITSKGGKRVYFACDTGLFYEMKFYGEEGIDAAFLPIGDNFTMGPDDALKAVRLLEPKAVIPVHYNTWPPIEQDAAAWVKRVNEETSAKGVLLKPGETYEVE